MKSLLKIGSLNIPKNRWLDALAVFDRIYVFCDPSETELENDKFVYIKFRTNRLSAKFIRVIELFNNRRFFSFICDLSLIALRFLNYRILRSVESLNVDYIHSSYNDFDESNFLTVLLRPKKQITRAQKETRVEYNHLEKLCLFKSRRIILNDKENIYFFEKKYKNVFKGKTMIIDQDEDYRKEAVILNVDFQEKYSQYDGKLHAVILAGAVLPNASEKRSGGRLYYIPYITELLNNNFIVHLHTKKIETSNGYDPYRELEQNDQNFHIEKTLDFENDYNNAYKILSSYDVGILHAFIENTPVTTFDKVNIPHRYYEYQIAHVVPIIKRDTNSILEKIFMYKSTGLVYNSLSEITPDSIKNVRFENKSFKNYISTLYFS